MVASTRRAMVGGGLGISLLAAAGNGSAFGRGMTPHQYALLEWLSAGWGQSGRAAAMHAVDAGFGYDDVECVSGIGRGYEHKITVYVLTAGQRRAFMPLGEIQAQWRS